MIVPHHIDQPLNNLINLKFINKIFVFTHPTKQKMTVNACDTPTIQLIMNDPILPRAPSCCENRGIPMQRQIRPLRIVPK